MQSEVLPSRESLINSISPSVISRKGEKDQLVNLNNRLVIYVEKVRSLESENSHLQSRVCAYEENRHNEVENMKAMFASELQETRKLLDELSKENAKFQIELISLKDKYDLQGNRIETLTNENKALEKEKLKTDNLLIEKTTQCESVIREKDNLYEAVDNVKAKMADLRKENESLRKDIKTETLQRIDAENKLLTAQEEIRFKERLHKEELAELRNRNTMTTGEVTKQVQIDYESELEDALLDLREQQNADLEMMKEGLEQNYNDKISKLTLQLDVARKSSMKSQEVEKLFEVKVEKLQITIDTLQKQTNKLEDRIRDLEGEVEVEGQLRSAAVELVEKERDEARETLARMEKDYSQLIDTNLLLDREISVYRNLLEQEEHRLNLSPSGSDKPGKSSKTRSRLKRKDIDSPAEATAAKKKRVVFAKPCFDIQTPATQGEGGMENIEENSDANKSCLIM